MDVTLLYTSSRYNYIGKSMLIHLSCTCVKPCCYMLWDWYKTTFITIYGCVNFPFM